MFTSEQQHFSQVHYVLSIQSKFRHSRATNRSQPDQVGQFLIPLEVFVPDIFSWMKERDFLQGDGVNGRHFDVLEIVATLAGARQIIFRIFAAKDLGNDMFSRKRVG
jgi:hypothetical protein